MQSLTPIQLEILQALSSGLTVTAAAAAAGIHRTTVHHWCRSVPEFRHTLDSIRQSRIDAIHEQLDALAMPSFAVLNAVLTDESASPSLRVRIALAILKFLAAPAKSATPTQGAFDSLLDSVYDSGRRKGQESVPSTTEIHHNSSHSSPKQSDEPTPQTPRNALCPCGSKLKFKRCCGRNAPPVLSRAA